MRKYRIMIVDDESEVREGIAGRVDWDAAGFIIVATAENGQDALEKSEFQATSLETLRQMVAANVGVTLLPMLAVKPPVARSENIRLLGFNGANAPSRRIAMVWRRSSAMGDFLQQLAQLFQKLPPELLTP